MSESEQAMAQRGASGTVRPLASFTLPEQRLILALVRLHDSPRVEDTRAASAARRRAEGRRSS